MTTTTTTVCDSPVSIPAAGGPAGEAIVTLASSKTPASLPVTGSGLASLADKSSEQLVSDMARSWRSRNRYDAAFLLMVGEFDDRDLAPSLGAASTVDWLIRQYDISRPTAYRMRSTGRVLLRYPNVREAYETGKLSADKLSLMKTYLDDENEPLLGGWR